MAGGGSSELRQVAVEMAQLAAWARALQQQQRDLARRLAKLEGQLDTKKAEAAERPGGEVAAEATGEAAAEPEVRRSDRGTEAKERRRQRSGRAN